MVIHMYSRASTTWLFFTEVCYVINLCDDILCHSDIVNNSSFNKLINENKTFPFLLQNLFSQGMLSVVRIQFEFHIKSKKVESL